MLKNIPFIILCAFSTLIHSRRLRAPLSRSESLRPYGLRRTFDKGFGDRYYHGLPAYYYRHIWPRWKEAIWENQNVWRYKHPPKWVGYYDYPYISWPNTYYLFGVPYYYNTRPKYISDTQQKKETQK